MVCLVPATVSLWIGLGAFIWISIKKHVQLVFVACLFNNFPIAIIAAGIIPEAGAAYYIF